MIDSMKLTKRDYETLADIAEAQYQKIVERQKKHDQDNDINYIKNLEYLELLIDKVSYMIGLCS